VASCGTTLLPSAETVYSCWKICSKIQIELLSKTVDLFMDWASWTAAKVSLPPCTGVPALVLPPLVDPPLVVPPDPPLDPQAASTTSAPAAVSAFSAVVRFVMKAPALMGAARGAAGNRSEQTFVQVNVAVTRRFVNRGSWG
jgi:hypothetical protein